MQDIDLATQTMFAELLARSLDAEFDETFDERGTFRRKKSKGRFYWHHQMRVGDKVVSKYVGPVTDKLITERSAAKTGPPNQWAYSMQAPCDGVARAA